MNIDFGGLRDAFSWEMKTMCMEGEREYNPENDTTSCSHIQSERLEELMAKVVDVGREYYCEEEEIQICVERISTAISDFKSIIDLRGAEWNEVSLCGDEITLSLVGLFASVPYGK